MHHIAATFDVANLLDLDKQRQLAALLPAYTPYDGRFDLRMPGVYAIRASRITTDLIPTTYQP